jgi:uncharacterized protein
MICIISDTHENVKVIKPAVAMIRDLNPSLVVHCGDIISPPILEHFKDLPMRFVFGNNDGEELGLRNKCQELGFGEIAEVLEINHEGKSILVYHGTNPYVLRAYIDAQNHDYIFTGHTHEQRDDKIGKTRVINPGALFRAKVYSFAKLDLDIDKLDFVTV